MQTGRYQDFWQLGRISRIHRSLDVKGGTSQNCYTITLGAPLRGLGEEGPKGASRNLLLVRSRVTGHGVGDGMGRLMPRCGAALRWNVALRGAGGTGRVRVCVLAGPAGCGSHGVFFVQPELQLDEFVAG